jgi:hypothetical protein
MKPWGLGSSESETEDIDSDNLRFFNTDFVLNCVFG